MAKKKVAAKKTAKRKPNPAFMKPLQPDEALAAIVGKKPLPRTEIMKKMWEYIKKNELQDEGDRRKINADANLKLVFDGNKQINMFQLAKHINEHVES